MFATFFVQHSLMENKKTEGYIMRQTTKTASSLPLLSASTTSYSTHRINNENQLQEQQQEQQQQNDARTMERNNEFRFFSDNTFSSAMMHSVGTLGRDEYVDRGGEIHVISIRRRETKKTRMTVASGTPLLSKEKSIPDYGQLQNLFRKKKKKKIAVISDADNDEEEDEEFELDDQVEGGSMTAAIFGVIKGTVGPAILYLPKGFQQAGFACAIPALIIATFAYIYSAHRLLECWKVEDARQHFLAERMNEIQSMFEQHHRHHQEKEEDERQNVALLGAAFKPKLLTYPELSRRAFGSFAFLIEFGIAAMQFGVCLTYLIFVPANLYASCQALFGIAVPRSYFLIGMLILEIPCTWVRDIRRLTPFNVLATILIVYGLGSCLLISLSYSYTQKDSTFFESMATLPALQPSWFMFIGTAFFVFEGSITLVVPLQEAVYKEEDRKRFPIVNQNVTICIVLFYMFFAMICWTIFGDQVQTALTASLPQGNFSTTVQFAYSIAVVLTYPLQAFPALEVTLKKIITTNDGDPRNKDDNNAINNYNISSTDWTRNFIASLLNIGLGVIAVIAIDYLGNVVSLIGSLVGMPIALVYPPLMHNLLVENSSSTMRCMNYFVSGVGFVATVAASYATIVNWGAGGEN